MKKFLAFHKALSVTTLSTAMLGAVMSLSSISSVAAAPFELEGIFEDNEPFSGTFSIEDQTLTDYEINVGSATIPTQSGPGTVEAFTYSSTACERYSSVICQNSGDIAPTSLQVSFFAASGGDVDSRSFTFNVTTGFPTSGGTVSGNAFESFQCSRCGGNVGSGFERAGIGTVTAVPEPETTWGVLAAGILGGAVMWKTRASKRV